MSDVRKVWSTEGPSEGLGRYEVLDEDGVNFLLKRPPDNGRLKTGLGSAVGAFCTFSTMDVGSESSSLSQSAVAIASSSESG